MIAGVLSVSTLIAFMAYTRHFFEPIEELGHWFAEMQMAQASAERILSLIEAQADIQDTDTVRAAIVQQSQFVDRSRDAMHQMRQSAIDGGKDAIHQIELKDVSFRYPPFMHLRTPKNRKASNAVLQNINLKISKGESIAIVGPTGGGKSTLVNLICRFYEPTSGEVRLDGIDYRNRSLHWLQSNIGMVLQNAHVFSGSIMENIRYGRLSASDEEVIEAAKVAGAHEFIDAYPDRYATDAGESGNRLSAGQRQLISFARAILADPQVLIMDEATSSVDTETEQKIQAGLHRLLAGRISLIIAHRLSTIRSASRIIVIEQGQIIEQGNHDSLVQLKGHYFDLYRQQSLQQTSQNISDTEHYATL